MEGSYHALQFVADFGQKFMRDCDAWEFSGSIGRFMLEADISVLW